MVIIYKPIVKVKPPFPALLYKTINNLLNSIQKSETGFLLPKKDTDIIFLNNNRKVPTPMSGPSDLMIMPK